MTTPALLGIDLGTTRTKVGLISADGEPLGFARAGHATDVDPTVGHAEQDPEAWWAGVGAAVREATAGAVPAGICVTGHGPSLTAVDAEGRAVRPAMTWLDSRSTTERDELEAATGLRGWALGVLPAARWLERHEPESAARARWYLNSWEALTLRLTGRAATTVVPGGVEVSRDALAGTGLALDRVAPQASAGTTLGGLTPDAGRHLGLPAGTPVVAGLVDAFASFHGARMLLAGDAIDVGGSAGGFGVYSELPIQVAGGFTTPAPLPGLFSVGGAMAATGAALDWFGSEILRGTAPLAELIAEAGRVEPGAEGLLFLPYLAGERSPLWDPIGTWRVRRAHAAPHPGAPRPRDPRGGCARDPARRRPDAPGGHRSASDAGVRRTGPRRRLEPDQGRRHRLHRRGAEGARDGRRRRRDRGRGGCRCASRTCRRRSGP